jgi:hypothetical protein
MPSAVHKVLMHGCIIIDPQSYHSEEASEAKNKEYKYARLNNTRNCSRTATNEDLIHALLVLRPRNSSLRCSLKKEPTDLNEEGVQLLHKDEIDYENHE